MAVVSMAKLFGMSLRKTPASILSTCPPTYVSDSNKWPSQNASLGWTCLFGSTISFWYACTMSSISHSVPVPFRSTSSGPSGMIVQREKMNGCTYFMYR